MSRATVGVATLALLAGLGLAAAQQPPQSAPAPAPAPGATAPAPGATAPAPADQAPRAEQQPPAVTEGRPSTAGPTPALDEQGKQATQSKSGQGGKEEPSSHAPTEKPMDTAALINGKLAAPGAPADSQTVPAKYSQRNAALDALAIMAVPLPLTEAQRRQIYASVSETTPASTNVAVKPAELLPEGLEIFELPRKITEEIPAVRGFKYARLYNTVLLVQPANRIVVGEIEK